MNGEVVFLFFSDVDRLLRLLYRGERPPLVQLLVCSCGRSADLRVSDAQAIGWQLLPHVQCPACRAREPYEGQARERYLALVDRLTAQKGRIV